MSAFSSTGDFDPHRALVERGIAVGPALNVVELARRARASTPPPEVDDEIPAAPPLAIAIPTIDEAVWQRPILASIRAYARMCGASPDAVLLQAMVRAGAAASPSARALTREHEDPTPLSLFAVTIGPSGAGKSYSTRIARRLVPIDGEEPPMDLPLGSGEGIAEAYMGEDPTSNEKKPGRAQVRHRAHFHVDEAEALMRLIKRDASTLGETLRRAFSGDVLGQRNATADRTRIVREYTLGLTLNATPGVVSAMLAYAELGLPQRFLWASALDPGAPDHPRRAPLPALPQLQETITFPGSVQEEISSTRRRSLRGELLVDELDAHLTIIRCRVAAILCGWDRRNEVSPNDWELAGLVLDASCRVRAWASAEAERRQTDDEAEDAERRGRIAQTVRGMTIVADDIAGRVSRRVGTFVHARTSATKRDLTRGCCRNKTERHVLAAAIELAMNAGWIVEADGAWKPGTAKPA